MEMRILAFGNEIMTRRLTASLPDDGIEVVGLSEMQEAVALLKQEKWGVFR